MMPDPKKPWKILNQKVVFRNPFLKVRVDNILGPDGKERSVNVTNSGHSNIIIPIDGSGLFYLVCQWRHPRNYYSWEFPGGRRDGQETSVETAKRELLEETGLSAKSLEVLGSLDLLSGLSENSYDILLAHEVRKIRKITDNEDGIQEVKAVTITELLSMIGSEIKNAQSIAALMLYLRNQML